jgi:hypothetical protein
MKRARTSKGQGIVELAAGLMVFIPIILLLIDCSIIMIGVSTNEAACRDAARAASSGPPASMSSGAHAVAAAAAPYARAKSIVKNVYAAGGLIKISETMTIKEVLQDPLPQAPAGGPLIGNVTVETTAEIYPPFLIRVFVDHGSYQFKNTQSYPYTYVMPAS